MTTFTRIEESEFPVPAQLETPTDHEQLFNHLVKRYFSLINRHGDIYGFRSEVMLILILKAYVNSYIPNEYRSSFPDSLPDIYSLIEEIINGWDKLFLVTQIFEDVEKA